MDLKERIKEIERVEGLTREELARKMGINYTRLRNLVGGQTKFRIDDLEALAKVFPRYEYWIYSGKELPCSGQISPMTKEREKS
ncbi:helix-turn-helix transcriptional regulator [Marinimicrobium sp. LS-A18]|uniref:helix-turn-helix domain-containing protein n=1 Tax=Marinimicrobium sp. LS-A18 TaxID=1381596 RepID=UPI0009DBD32E